jgi:hypothetical protein
MTALEVAMLKSPYRLIALFLLIVLAGFVASSAEVSAKKPKKKKTTTKIETVIYAPPTLQLTATPAVITACAGEAGSSAARVQLDAGAAFPSGAKPRYKWSASGGQIVGDGPTPTWDLSGLQPGYYKAFVEADCGYPDECVAFSSVMVLVKCQPPMCPSIIVSGPDKVRVNQSVTFSARVTGGSPNITPVYNWTVSAGKIVSGDGTNTITVDTTGLGGQSIGATVSIPGYDALNCSASGMVPIQPETPGCRKFDMCENCRFNDEKARLDNYGIELQNDPTATAYVIVYPGRGGKPGDVQKHTTRILDYLVNSRGIDSRRIVTRVGPVRGEPTVELWICPQGAKAPSIE